jgi:hypothetical protein
MPVFVLPPCTGTHGDCSGNNTYNFFSERQREISCTIAGKEPRSQIPIMNNIYARACTVGRDTLQTQ